MCWGVNAGASPSPSLVLQDHVGALKQSRPESLGRVQSWDLQPRP